MHGCRYMHGCIYMHGCMHGLACIRMCTCISSPGRAQLGQRRRVDSRLAQLGADEFVKRSQQGHARNRLRQDSRRAHPLPVLDTLNRAVLQIVGQT